LSEGHGKTIVSVENNELQYEISKKVIDEGLNVRQTEALIKNINNVKAKTKDKTAKDIYIKDIEDKLKTLLGTKVSINKGRKKGKIEIEYYNNEDLERIIDMFNM
jgi:ParB family transcriptional regulator, chromosome partitioning protein